MGAPDSTEEYCPPVRSVIPDAPVGTNHLVPEGFSLRDEQAGRDALYRMVPQGQGGWRAVGVCDAPLVLSAWLSNETSGGKMLELRWKALGKWRTITAPITVLTQAGRIVDLADRGLPVDSGNAKWLVKFITAYLRVNRRQIQARKITEQMGWCRGAFVLGDNCAGGSVHYQSPDEGDRQHVEAYASRGTWSGWTDAVAPSMGYPRVALGFYAAFAAPLLHVTGCRNFVVSYAGETSTGKTTALRIAASVWGQPDDRDPRGTQLLSWDSTQVYIERAAAARCDLPLIVDDTKRARQIRGESVVPSAIYQVANGAGRGRGSIKGSRRTVGWRTVMITSGEARITDMSRDGGVAARLVELWGSPYGRSAREAVAAANRGVLEHHGLAGAACVAWLIDQRAEWVHWRRQWADLSKHYGGELEGLGVGVADRVGGYLALIDLAGRLAHRALDLPWRYRCPVPGLLAEIAQSGKSSDRASEALAWAYEWAVSNQRRFWQPGAEGSDAWLGRWDRRVREADPDWRWIGFISSTLRTELERAGFDAEAVVRTWADRGWLVTDARSDGRARRTRRARVASDTVRVVAVRRDAFEGPESVHSVDLFPGE